MHIAEPDLPQTTIRLAALALNRLTGALPQGRGMLRGTLAGSARRCCGAQLCTVPNPGPRSSPPVAQRPRAQRRRPASEPGRVRENETAGRRPLQRDVGREKHFSAPFSRVPRYAGNHRHSTARRRLMPARPGGHAGNVGGFGDTTLRSQAVGFRNPGPELDRGRPTCLRRPGFSARRRSQAPHLQRLRASLESPLRSRASTELRTPRPPARLRTWV